MAAVLLLSPLARHLVVERRVNDAIELIDVHGTDAVIKALVFGLMAFNRLLVLAPLIGVAGVQCIAHPFQHLVIKVQPAQKFGELLLKHLLAHILAPAGGRIALAFIGMTGAVIVDVAFLLDLADHRAAAGMAGDQPGEGEVACHAAVLLRQPAVHYALHPLPEFDRNNRFVTALVSLPVPLEPPAVEPVAQDCIDRAGRDLGAALAVDQPEFPHLRGRIAHRILAAGVPLEQLGNDRRDSRVGDDDLLAVRAGDVAITERRLGRPDALLGLFLHSLAGFLGQVVDVVLRHQHLDAVHELFRRPGLSGEDHAFLGEVHLDIEFVHRHPVLQVAVEPVGFLHQQRPDRRMRLQILNHLPEGSAPGRLGRLHVNVFLRHLEALRRSVFLQQLQLRRNRVALLLLLL